MVKSDIAREWGRAAGFITYYFPLLHSYRAVCRVEEGLPSLRPEFPHRNQYNECVDGEMIQALSPSQTRQCEM
eukprot:scaffold13290_cov150-Skeletonema_menzelii.AAC.2